MVNQTGHWKVGKKENMSVEMMTKKLEYLLEYLLEKWKEKR
jgi:hypothetical protein